MEEDEYDYKHLEDEDKRLSNGDVCFNFTLVVMVIFILSW